MCMMIIYDTYVGIHIRIYNKEVLVMSASKDTKRGTWKVYIRYKDWQGIGQVHTKRGFATKREALEYEREFLLKKSKDVNMGFPQFVEVYMEDMKPRLKLNTFLTKKHIMETKIIPYFEKKSLAEITATDVIQWQNQLLSMRDENGIRRKWRYRLKSQYSTKGAETVTARHISRRKSGMSIKEMDWKRSIGQRLLDLMQCL